MTPEGREQKDFRSWLKGRGLKFVRLALMPGVQAGWPDWIILLPVWPLLIEMKKPELRGKDGRSERQKLRHAELLELGYDVVTVYSADEAIGAVLAALDARALPAPWQCAPAVGRRGGAVAGPGHAQDVDRPARLLRPEGRGGRPQDAGRGAEARLRAGVAAGGGEVGRVPPSHVPPAAWAQKGQAPR